MEDFITGRFGKTAGKWALKEALALTFIGACILAKYFPIFDDGYYKLDAVLYMIIGGLLYFGWEATR